MSGEVTVNRVVEDVIDRRKDCSIPGVENHPMLSMVNCVNIRAKDKRPDKSEDQETIEIELHFIWNPSFGFCISIE